ncbi:MAG: 1-deoxy-D-xylulose-5-phosphate reductoisomerase [Eubacteriales bacterium]|nr:1-deoxy-D-xylulose-5-phosphate reductoisomerase [Eubacteriales bacterium]HRV33234.1 1-deoxy-D-xylulose-5-phosphate reductoisomerase [Anaerovoracaceae bacterium]
MKNIALLGATGSIGTQVLEVVRANPDRFRVCSMTAGWNTELFSRQIQTFKPMYASVATENDARILQKLFPQVQFSWGMEGLCAAASLGDVRMTVNGLMGMIGLQPTMAAVNAGKDVALANKETLVTGGEIVMDAVRRAGVEFLPVDSEHSAIFQCLQNQAPPRRLILTASGGPFRGYSCQQLRTVTRAQALKHPNWTMGAKITVDSATMMNKGLEVIEARWLFDMEPDRIDVVIHPESILHSAVVFRDGSVIGQMGKPDMKIPIAYALSYPERLENSEEHLELTEPGCLHFEKPDPRTFRCLGLALEAVAAGGSYPAVLNAANEEAVTAFLRDEICFAEIAELVETVLQGHKSTTIRSVEEILALESETRRMIRSILSKKAQERK